MKKIVGLLFLAMASLASAKISLTNLDRLEDYALADRLMLMKNDPRPRPSQQFAQLSGLEVKTEIFLLIEDLRKKAKSVRKQISHQSPLLRALAPACYPIREKGQFKSKESFPCFAGDALIYRQLKLRSLDPIGDVLSFSTWLYKAAESAESDLDALLIYQNFDPKHDVKKFFALMAAISTSGNSGLTGWLQGLEDRFLVEDLNSGLSDEQVYIRFKSLQAAKIRYQILRDILDEKKLKFKIFGKDISSWNRHNLMAAFLGCMDIYSKEEEHLQAIHFAGKSYESIDFISHILSGVGIKHSIVNYQQDTERYQIGGNFGLRMCQGLIE